MPSGTFCCKNLIVTVEQEIQRLSNEVVEVLRTQNERLVEQIYPKRIARICCATTTLEKDVDERTIELEQKLKRIEDDNKKLQQRASEAEFKCRNFLEQLVE